MEINSYTRHHELPANEGDYGILWGGLGGWGMGVCI